ncbi:GIN domain-containing protein [Cognatitamlana onchidii]|uniref:GIN domain-containing protein n=1 Tax=Cognatitamlana onchidii TaxID=2562860 RepID=UPI0010A68937|nr:DUF2807 domain-containing protein [Algibacter onchidii]
MKTNRHYIVLIVISFFLCSCHEENIGVYPDDSISFKDIVVENYHSIEIANNVSAFITFSDTEESITIESNSNLQDLIVAKIANNTLTVKLKNNIHLKSTPTLNVYITTKSIENIKAAADSNIKLENTWIANEAHINITADSNFTGPIDVNTLNLKATADAQADLYGDVNYLDAFLSADAALIDYDLKVHDLKLKMTADCVANLTVSHTISIDAVADCTLNYRGHASIIHKRLKADSKIRKMN